MRTKATTTAPSPTTTRRSSSTRNSPGPTTTAATPSYTRATIDRAIADCTKAIELDPKLAAAYTDRGDAELQQGRPRPRHRRLQPRRSSSTRNSPMPTTTAAGPMRLKATTTAPSPTTTRRSSSTRNSPIAYYNRGVAYETKGDHDRAIADYNQAIELNPKFTKPTTTAASPSYIKGDLTAPLPTSTGRSSSTRNSPLAYSSRGDAELIQGRPRPRHRRPQQSDRARSEMRRQPIAIGAKLTSSRVSMTWRSPISIGQSSSIQSLPMPSGIVLVSIAPKVNTILPSPTSTRPCGSSPIIPPP